SIVLQTPDGIRDRNVPGFQTCALPISGTSTSSKSETPSHSCSAILQAASQAKSSTSTPATISWHRYRTSISGPGPSFRRRPGFLCRAAGGAGWCTEAGKQCCRPRHPEQRPSNGVAGRGIPNGDHQTVLPAAVSRTETIKQCCRPRHPERGPSNGVAGRGIPNGGEQTVLPAAVSRTEAIKWCCRPRYPERRPSNIIAGLRYLKWYFYTISYLASLLFA